MRSRFMTAACTLALLGASGVAVEPGQLRPGEMTKAEVWIRNGASEAVPVALTAVGYDKPLRVVVTNGDAPSSPPVRVRLVPTTWEYRAVVVKTGDDTAAALARPGLEGWETTGIVMPRDDGNMLLLKRPR